jgi:hypothetical protein
MAIIPLLTRLSVHALLSKLDACSLELLLREAAFIYKLSYKRTRWNEETQGCTILLDEGIIGTYLSREALNKALEQHIKNIKEQWLNTVLTNGNRAKDIIPFPSTIPNNNEVCMSIDSTNDINDFQEELLCYSIEPLLQQKS